MKNINFLIFLALFTIFSSCKNQETKNATEGTLQTGTLSKDGKHKYGIKSGIVEYATTSMGMNVDQVLYFDDYGSKEATEMVMEVAGIKSHTRNIIKDGYSYSLDMVAKTCTKFKLTGPKGIDIDFSNLTKEIEKQMNLKKVGNEDFAGKTCEKYTIDNKDFGMKGTFLVWKGVSLKSDVDISTMKTHMEAKNFQENASVSQDMFVIPSDFKIIEQ